MSPAPNEPCVCDSGRKFKKCCYLPLEGQPAATPEALMRSRYAAYALGNVEHILRTTHPDGPHWRADTGAWRAEVDAFCRQTAFERLEVVEARAVGDRGIVSFRAHLSGPGGSTVLTERSLFLREDGRWLYHSGATGPADGA